MQGEEIKAWFQSGQDWKTGCALYEKYGTELQFKLRLKRSAELPLIKQLLADKLKRIMGARHVSMPKVTIPKAVPVITIQEKKKNDEEIDIAALEMENARLYNQRAMLSNQMQDPKGDERIRLENVRLIKEIQSIHAKMLSNRELIRDLYKGEAKAVVPEEAVPSTGNIVVRMQKIDYTLDDLKGMSPIEIQYLREQVRQQASKARLRARTGASEETRKSNQNKARVKEKELKLIDKIRAAIQKRHGKE